ncbi:unnamed protein product [Prorocentrum cordatum]|nr:unnamed protein product [Polarella glacialis]
MWPRSRHGRPRPLVVWVLGGSEACEGRLARAGYFEDAAGLLGQGWPVMCMDLVFVGTRRWEGLPCGRRARASSVVEPLAEGAPPPDLAVLLNPGLGELDEAGARALDSLLPQIGPLLDGSVCSEGGGAPCVATTSRCEEVAVGERALFERLGASIVLGPVRNLFSGAAAAPAARYDDNGWAVVARGRGGTPRPGSGAEVARSAAYYMFGSDAAARAAPGGGHSAGEGLSEFSGHGAAIKESLRLSAARGDCAGDEPGEAPQRAMLVENKRLTHDAFRDGGYEHLLPRQLCLPRVYTAALAREIVEGLHLGWRDACVLKLCNRARGAGCVPLRCSELDEALRLLLSPPDITQEWLREQHPRFSRACSWGCFEEQLRHWWSNECPVFVAEPCHRSVLTEKDGRGFDGTLRLGFALHRIEGAEGGDELEVMTENGPWRGRRARQASLDLAGRPGERALSSTEMRRWFGAQESGALVLEWLGGYWKLPEEDVTSPDLRGRVVSKARQGTAPVSGAHLHEVYAAVGDAVENAFGASGMGVQQLRQRYPEARELCAFLTARLACTVRGREPGRGRMLLKLADEYNSRGSGWPQRYVKSYIERSLGIFEALRGRWDEADGCFERSLAAMPTNATAKYLRGMSSLEAGDFRAAVSWMEACLQLDPDFKAPYVNIAVAHLSLRDWESAAEASQAGLGRHPGTPQCLYNLGLALFWTALEAEEAGHFSPHPLRQGALDSLQAARDCPEKRAAQWTEADDKLLWELRFRESTMHRPLKWGGWKYYAWRP